MRIGLPEEKEEHTAQPLDAFSLLRFLPLSLPVQKGPTTPPFFYFIGAWPSFSGAGAKHSGLHLRQDVMGGLEPAPVEEDEPCCDAGLPRS